MTADPRTGYRDLMARVLERVNRLDAIRAEFYRRPTPDPRALTLLIDAIKHRLYREELTAAEYARRCEALLAHGLH